MKNDKKDISLYEVLQEIQQEFSLDQKEKFKNEIIKLILNKKENENE